MLDNIFSLPSRPNVSNRFERWMRMERRLTSQQSRSFFKQISMIPSLLTFTFHSKSWRESLPRHFSLYLNAIYLLNQVQSKLDCYHCFIHICISRLIFTRERKIRIRSKQTFSVKLNLALMVMECRVLDVTGGRVLSVYFFKRSQEAVNFRPHARNRAMDKYKSWVCVCVCCLAISTPSRGRF